jgi:protein KRI1
MPTRFKYARTAPSSFGLTPVEILLATDAELNAIASVKHIAPYRQGGLGMAGKGLGKRVRELKDELRARKWGEENQNQNQSQSSSGAGARARDSGWPRKGGEGSGEGKRPGKRMGKKERMKAKVAAGAAGEMSVEHAGEKRTEAPAKAVSAPEHKRGGEGGDDGGGGEGERKKKRRKKEHGHEGAGGVVV